VRVRESQGQEENRREDVAGKVKVIISPGQFGEESREKNCGVVVFSVPSTLAEKSQWVASRCML
jgi:hypothetical protein